MATNINLSTPVHRGDTLYFEFNWTDTQEPPQPVDMRGKTVIFTMKISPYIADADAAVRVEKFIEAEDSLGAQGTVLITVPKSQSANLIAGTNFHYACRVITPDEVEDIEVTHVFGTVPVKDA